MTIFVYGSLKQNGKLHSYLGNSEFLGYALTCEKYPLVPSRLGWYPYLIDKPKRGYFIKGELYKITLRTVKRLDRLEEAPHYYRRKEICVKIGCKTTKAWTYFVKKPPKFNTKELLEEF